jgi:hypothetical protein
MIDRSATRAGSLNFSRSAVARPFVLTPTIVAFSRRKCSAHTSVTITIDAAQAQVVFGVLTAVLLGDDVVDFMALDGERFRIQAILAPTLGAFAYRSLNHKADAAHRCASFCSASSFAVRIMCSRRM